MDHVTASKNSIGNRCCYRDSYKPRTKRPFIVFEPKQRKIFESQTANTFSLTC